MDKPHFFYYQLMHSWVVPTLWLLCIMLIRTFTYKSGCKLVLSVLRAVQLRVKLLGYTAILWWTFWYTAKLSLKVSEPFYIPFNNVREFQYFSILVNTYYWSFSLILVILIHLRCYLVVWICISLLLSNVVFAHVFKYLYIFFREISVQII